MLNNSSNNSFLCPNCQIVIMEQKGTEDLPIPSGITAGTATITSASASGSTINQSWQIIVCPNCGFSCYHSSL